MRIALVVVLFIAAGGRTIADGMLQGSTTVENLSSPSNAYGPWVYEHLDLAVPPSGAAGIHFENRRASDRFHPQTAADVVLDSYNTVNPALTLYTAVESGTAAPYARFRVTAEADLKAARGLVPFIGASAGSGYGIGATHSLTSGAYYYFGDNYAVVRFTPFWSDALGEVQSYSAALALGHPGIAMHTFRAGFGGENDISLISPGNPTLLGEHEFGASYTLKQWLSKKAGVTAGIDYGTLTRAGGARIYSRTGFTLGVFAGI